MGDRLRITERIAPSRFYSVTDAAENTSEQIQNPISHPWISQETMTTTLEGKIYKQPPRYPSS
jgi:hypothetical protein